MRQACGIRIVGGTAIGRIWYFHQDAFVVDEGEACDCELELSRFEQARQRVQKNRHALYEKALAEVGEEEAGIFEAHEMMLDDDDLIETCTGLIKDEKHTAEYAVREGFDSASRMFLEMDDDYFRARSADVLDLKNEMLRVLSGADSNETLIKEPYILAAEDLSPSDTVKLDRSLLLGIVTKQGSENSHTAILARSLGIPSIIQCDGVSEDWDGKKGILDGDGSRIFIEPETGILTEYEEKLEQESQEKKSLQALKGAPSTTLDGRTIKIYANIGGPSDIDSVIENDAEGVGLFRSEFVYLGKMQDPTEDEQFEAYRKVAEDLSPRQVIIRTCDIGADKTIDYMNLDRDDNPALGFRAIRICLTRKDFFKRQLRAILRASAYGNLGIMFPMITSVWEVRECRQILDECRQELEREGQKTGDPVTGIMIETPAAALIADDLACEVDFFSVGTNDLTQYTCAIDRQNAKLAKFADPHHPAVLKLIQMTVEAGHRQGIWVGICGELAGDQSLTETFIRMGVDELSVSPVRVLPLRKTVRQLDLREE